MRYNCVRSLLTVLLLATSSVGGPLDWPEPTRDQRPWVYNWWLGSAVDEGNLAKEFARYREAGLGGVHVVPIYGAKGAEDRYIDYLSPKWMHMFTFAIEEAASNDLGLDVTTGTGWCFGGPDIRPDLGCRRMFVKSLAFPADGRLPENLRPERVTIQAVVAVGPNDETRSVSVTDELTDEGTISWQPPGDGWKVWVLGHRFAGRMVKRAAPGGEGPMLNPFHAEAMRNYLKRFDEAFAATETVLPRAMYHDSYEYSGDWSPDLPEEFARRRGYRIEDELPALAGEGDADRVARVRCDVGETLSDMMIENVFPQWIHWCRERGIMTRNQAHGSPGNWLDLYALADVPETEMFGHGGPDPRVSQFDEHVGGADRDPLVAKFASSAAHVTNKRLVSAETGTWLAEHFCETFEELKCLVDLMFLGGVNHVFYHGCVYSPDDAAWPGWLFYASTQFNPRNPLWREAPTLNEYVTRCQSILQSGQPDNDVLLYWPIHDAWTDGVRDMTVHNMPAMRGALGRTARVLWTRGYGFDYVSDRLLEAMKFHGGVIKASGGPTWRVVVVPECRHMPPATLQDLLDLAQNGATVIFENRLPTDVPGLGTLEERRAALREQIARLGAGEAAFAEANSPLTTSTLGKGRVLVGKLEEALVAADVRRETLVDHPGVLFVRRRHDEGRHYFVVNHGLKPLDAKLPLATPPRSVVILDPMTGRTGVADARREDGAVVEVRVRLEPGHSLILRTFESKDVRGPRWASNAPLATLTEIGGPWRLEFVTGGPELPGPLTMDALESWTNVGDESTRAFAGTARYRCLFDLRDDRLPADPVLLDLGEVKHVARVYLNDECLGASIMRPHRLVVPSGVLRSKRNVLDIEVTNLAANRIRDLDRRKIPWKIFRDANIVNIRYRRFDAADWPIFDSGLLGPVRIRSAETTAKEM